MAIFRPTAMALLILGALSVPGIARAAGAPPTLKGPMGVFTPDETPDPAPPLTIAKPDGGTLTLADFKGRVVLLNLWATWCAPCVKEMPALDRLQKKLGGKDFEVVALSLDRGGAVQVRPFFEERGIGALSVYLDPKSTAMMALKPRGLPTTYLIGRDGRILGTMIGEAEWDGAEAEALIRHYLGTAS